MRAPGVIDLDVACFPMFDACAAAGIKPATLRDWLSREPAIILLRRTDRHAAGLDCGPFLTLRRVLQIALTAELKRLGVMAQRAANLAAMFTDQGGEKPADWRCHPGCVPREAGRLFPAGGTVLVANKDGRHGPIIAAVRNAPLTEVLSRHDYSGLAIDVAAIVRRVLLALRVADRRAEQAVGLAVGRVRPPGLPARAVAARVLAAPVPATPLPAAMGAGVAS